MLGAGLQLGRRRSVWRLAYHHVHQRRPIRRSAGDRRVSRPRPQLPPTSESAGALLALLMTMAVVDVYSNPVSGSFESAEFVAEHFKTSRRQVQQGRMHTLMTSTVYTPVQGYTLLNMMWLVISGRHVCRALGNARFLALFVGSGSIANVVSLTSKVEERDDPVFPRLQIPGGGSAAVDCIVTLNALLYPPSRVALTRRWMRWPLWFFSAMFLTRDERERPPWETKSAPREAHATGVICGLMAFLLLRRRPGRW